jgi:hypothetical protein
MNYKETIFFIGKCLTVTKNSRNRTVIEKKLKNLDINWENIVKVSTAHYVFPTLYCNFKKVGFLKYLPNDLVEYMEHITNLNRERNEQILLQAKEINELLSANNITPIFLKGTGNLLENLYDDIAERMVGDIDFIISKNDYKKTIILLKKSGYYSKEESHNERTFHWHYAKLIKKGRIASVEVHNKILSKTNNKYFNVFNGEKKYYTTNGYSFFKDDYKLLNTTLPKIVNDNLYLSKTIVLRTVYDVFLISKLSTIQIPEVYSISLRKKLLDYIACMELIFGTKFIEETNEEQSNTYIKKYISVLNNSKLEKFKINVSTFTNLQTNRLSLFFKSFYDKEYRDYAYKRVFKKELYKNILKSK